MAIFGSKILDKAPDNTSKPVPFYKQYLKSTEDLLSSPFGDQEPEPLAKTIGSSFAAPFRQTAQRFEGLREEAGASDPFADLPEEDEDSDPFAALPEEEEPSPFGAIEYEGEPAPEGGLGDFPVRTGSRPSRYERGLSWLRGDLIEGSAADVIDRTPAGIG